MTSSPAPAVVVPDQGVGEPEAGTVRGTAARHAQVPEPKPAPVLDGGQRARLQHLDRPQAELRPLANCSVAGGAGAGQRRHCPEPHPHSGGEQRRVVPFQVPHRCRRPAEQSPSAGGARGVNGRQAARDRDGSGGHRQPRAVQPGHFGEGRVEPGEVAEAGGEAEPADLVFGRGVPRDHLRHRQAGERRDVGEVGTVVADVDLGHPRGRGAGRRGGSPHAKQPLRQLAGLPGSRPDRDQHGPGARNDLDHVREAGAADGRREPGRRRRGRADELDQHGRVPGR